MKKEKIRCTKNCPANGYDFSLKRCRFGWINPPQLRLVKNAVAYMGKSYICEYNEHKDKV